MTREHKGRSIAGRSTLTESSAPSTPQVGKHTLTERIAHGEAAGAAAAVQRTVAAGTAGGDTAAVHASAQRGIATSASPLPHLDRLQQLFGRHDVSGMQAHTGADAAASAREMGAQAYATGSHVVLGGGSDLHTVAHEAAHVVQQRGGVQLKGGVGNVGDTYEQHADAVADEVVKGESAESLLDQVAGSVPHGASTAVASGANVQRKLRIAGRVLDPKDKVDAGFISKAAESNELEPAATDELMRRARDDTYDAELATAAAELKTWKPPREKGEGKENGEGGDEQKDKGEQKDNGEQKDKREWEKRKGRSQEGEKERGDNKGEDKGKEKQAIGEIARRNTPSAHMRDEHGGSSSGSPVAADPLRGPDALASDLDRCELQSSDADLQAMLRALTVYHGESEEETDQAIGDRKADALDEIEHAIYRFVDHHLDALHGNPTRSFLLDLLDEVQQAHIALVDFVHQRNLELFARDVTDAAERSELNHDWDRARAGELGGDAADQPELRALLARLMSRRHGRDLVRELLNQRDGQRIRIEPEDRVLPEEHEQRRQNRQRLEAAGAKLNALINSGDDGEELTAALQAHIELRDEPMPQEPAHADPSRNVVHVLRRLKDSEVLTLDRHDNLIPAPAFLIFGHELIHALHYVKGERVVEDAERYHDGGDRQGWTSSEEFTTITGGDSDPGQLSENLLRAEHQLTARHLHRDRRREDLDGEHRLDVPAQDLEHEHEDVDGGQRAGMSARNKKIVTACVLAVSAAAIALLLYLNRSQLK
jgi:hypothetical protein